MFMHVIKMAAVFVGVTAAAYAVTGEKIPFAPHVGYALHCFDEAIASGNPANIGPTCRLAGRLAVWTGHSDDIKAHAAQALLKGLRGG